MFQNTKQEFVCTKFQVFLSSTNNLQGSSRDVVANVLDSDIVVSEIEFKSRYYVHVQINTLGIRYEPPYPYLPTPPFRQDMTQGQFLSGV